MYNLTFLNESSNVYALVEGVNTQSGGWFIGVMLILFWILIFMVLNRFDTKDVFIVTNFIMSTLTGLLLAANLISWTYLIIPLILLFIGLFMKIYGE